MGLIDFRCDRTEGIAKLWVRCRLPDTVRRCRPQPEGEASDDGRRAAISGGSVRHRWGIDRPGSTAFLVVWETFRK